MVMVWWCENCIIRTIHIVPRSLIPFLSLSLFLFVIIIVNFGWSYYVSPSKKIELVIFQQQYDWLECASLDLHHFMKISKSSPIRIKSSKRGQIQFNCIEHFFYTSYMANNLGYLLHKVLNMTICKFWQIWTWVQMQALQILVDMKGTKENEEHYFLRTSRYQGDCEVLF